MAYVSSWTTHRPVVGDGDTASRDAVLSLWGDRPAAVFETWRVRKPEGTRQTVVWYKAAVGPGMGDLSMPWGCATEEIYILGAGWTGRRRPNLITTREARGNPYGAAARRSEEHTSELQSP